MHSITREDLYTNDVDLGDLGLLTVPAKSVDSRDRTEQGTPKLQTTLAEIEMTPR